MLCSLSRLPLLPEPVLLLAVVLPFLLLTPAPLLRAQMLAVRELGGGIIEIQTSCASAGTTGLEAKFHAGSGEIVRVKPSRARPADGGQSEYEQWLACCEQVVAKRKGAEWVRNAEASLSTFRGVRGPHEMMLCKPSGKDKHRRAFRLDCDACTIEWAPAELWTGSGASAVKRKGKGPFLITGVKETQPATTTTVVNPLADSFPVEVKCLEVELLGAEAVLIRPEAGGEYEEWLACLRSVGMKGAAMAKMRK